MVVDVPGFWWNIICIVYLFPTYIDRSDQVRERQGMVWTNSSESVVELCFMSWGIFQLYGSDRGFVHPENGHVVAFIRTMKLSRSSGHVD
jgi:hypothetical protein